MLAAARRWRFVVMCTTWHLGRENLHLWRCAALAREPPSQWLPYPPQHASLKTAGLGIEPLAAESDGNHIPFLQSWTIRASTTKQAIIEALDELPENESFHNIDAIFEGLTTLRQRRMTELLTDCTRVQDEGPTDPLFRTILVYVASSGRPRTKCWMSGAVPERHPVAP
ncbi:hypothetical protein GGI59_002683 [Rhizobium lentis]|uniref:Uncharacterized protein n=1 Tax=Rhizobium lentis TaxID=1138194 RepID=A0A7W8UN55_9HYPH|nr:type IV toxin-antitoxin system AbiEi family antitoxin domain-containing protein [Rhizobium lentis]MBB4574943.1 hypothetical protein [Rhizobium lentis]MBB5550870.1 hypothetical protein [Rhizobium lentis]MBB5561008.1 hypothetical protein [Rhizobium lentis]MBB5567989.1 hypothetical protein [Rhizobium lentis]